MKTKLLTILAALLIVSVDSMSARESYVEIDGIKYILNSTTFTASVTSKSEKYAGEIKIPSSVVYETYNYETYKYEDRTYIVTSIGYMAFAFCTGLTRVSIPESVTSIEHNAFDGCESLVSIVIPNSVISIGSSAFESCTNLVSVNFGNSVTSIGSRAFTHCKSLSSILISPKITELSSWIFYGCTALKAIDIPSSVAVIGSEAFRGCTGLTNVHLHEGTYSIKNGAFYGCTGLTSIVIPDDIISIEYSAFAWCSNIKSVTIGRSVTNLDYTAFEYCLNLESVTILSEAILNSGHSMSAYFGSRRESEKNEIIIGDEITSIGNYAMSGQYIKSITIPNSVQKIGDYAFYSCPWLTEIRIGNGVRSIGEYAFAECRALRSLTISSNVTTINDWAFHLCTDLKYVTCEAINPPSCSLLGPFDFYFDDPKSLCVPAGTENAYMQADIWKYFSHISSIQYATETNVTAVQAEPAKNSVIIKWPAANADIYSIDILKNNELINTYTFNDKGQLLKIAYHCPAQNGPQKSVEETDSTIGWEYNVGGLDAGTTYTCTITAKDFYDVILYNETITFKTQTSPTDIETIFCPSNKNVKVISEGKFYIEHNGLLFDVTGKKVR